GNESPYHRNALPEDGTNKKAGYHREPSNPCLFDFLSASALPMFRALRDVSNLLPLYSSSEVASCSVVQNRAPEPAAKPSRTRFAETGDPKVAAIADASNASCLFELELL